VYVSVGSFDNKILIKSSRINKRSDKNGAIVILFVDELRTFQGKLARDGSDALLLLVIKLSLRVKLAALGPADLMLLLNEQPKDFLSLIIQRLDQQLTKELIDDRVFLPPKGKKVGPRPDNTVATSADICRNKNR
jgi:hypothetical protein